MYSGTWGLEEFKRLGPLPRLLGGAHVVLLELLDLLLVLLALVVHLEGRQPGASRVRHLALHRTLLAALAEGFQTGDVEASSAMQYLEQMLSSELEWGRAGVGLGLAGSSLVAESTSWAFLFRSITNLRYTEPFTLSGSLLTTIYALCLIPRCTCWPFGLCLK